MYKLVLAATHHDPDGSLAEQTRRMLARLQQLFVRIAVHATTSTNQASLDWLQAQGVLVDCIPPVGHALLGRARRGAVELGTQLQASHMLFCDLDRVLHWAEYYPAELERTLPLLPQWDCCVLGRTPRAFASHPRTQRETEVIINACYAQVSGKPWDITAAARGLSQRAAMQIVAACTEDSVGTDGVWPLFCAQHGLTLGYLETEGLEFETPDRCGPAIAAAGGLQAWLAQFERSIPEWTLRLDIAAAEVGALQAYAH